MRLVPITELQLPNDDTVIPRLREDPFLVTEYAAAMRLYGGWGDFPPAIVDQDMLILSGVTRFLAAEEVGVTEVPIEEVVCDSPGERLLVAAAANATHGKRWSSKDFTNIVLLAERFGVPSDELALAMRVRIEKVERVPITTVIRGVGKKKTEQKIYVKKAVRPFLRGRILSEGEEAIMKRLATPQLADAVLRDLLRLDALDALPQLTSDSLKTVLAAQEVLERWLDRDQHLLTAVA